MSKQTKQVVIILLVSLILVSATVILTSMVIDRRWQAFIDGPLQLEHEAEIAELEAYSKKAQQKEYDRGYFLSFYSTCYIWSLQDEISCIRAARVGYREGVHNKPAPPGWDWFLVKYNGRESANTNTNTNIQD